MKKRRKKRRGFGGGGGGGGGVEDTGDWESQDLCYLRAVPSCNHKVCKLGSADGARRAKPSINKTQEIIKWDALVFQEGSKILPKRK